MPATKAYLTFKGAGANSTTIQYGDDAAKAGSTAKSASVIILSDFFIAEDIAFKVSSDEQQSFNSHLVENFRSPSSNCEILINWSYTVTKFPVVLMLKVWPSFCCTKTPSPSSKSSITYQLRILIANFLRLDVNKIPSSSDFGSETILLQQDTIPTL